jgi:hypothetical protein
VATDDQREHLGRLMALLIEHEPAVHYRELRPMQTGTIHTEAQLVAALKTPSGVTMDCSEAVTLLCRLAGLRDPNRRGYDGSGFTGTMLATLPHYHDPKGAKVGALVVFGPREGEHVCMVLKPDHKGGNPHLFSLGGERGPIDITLKTERKYHRPPVTFLSIAGL